MLVIGRGRSAAIRVDSNAVARAHALVCHVPDLDRRLVVAPVGRRGRPDDLLHFRVAGGENPLSRPAPDRCML